VQSAPFAFDVAADQITYNSCSGSQVQNKQGYFTFRIGAYRNTGLKLKQEFYDHINKNFKPAYPSDKITLNQYKQILQKSPANAGAIVYFGLRSVNKPRSLFSPYAPTPSEGTDYAPLASELSDDRFMDALVTGTPVAVNYFPKAPEQNQKVFEAQLNYNKDEAFSRAVSEEFRNNILLALTYKSGTGEADHLPRRPAGAPENQAYGRGYRLAFGLPATTARGNNPLNVVNAVQEVSLMDNKPTTGQWNCNRKYTIVRPSDAAVSCPEDNFQYTADQRQEYAILRRHLPAQDWRISVQYGCLVPKTVDCYGSEMLNGALVQVEYDIRNECFDKTKQITEYDNPARLPVKSCAQFVSVCLRTN
jgi:hypothetical protein